MNQNNKGPLTAHRDYSIIANCRTTILVRLHRILIILQCSKLLFMYLFIPQFLKRYLHVLCSILVDLETGMNMVHAG